jgi:hypothetical protein
LDESTAVRKDVLTTQFFNHKMNIQNQLLWLYTSFLDGFANEGGCMMARTVLQQLGLGIHPCYAVSSTQEQYYTCTHYEQFSYQY